MAFTVEPETDLPQLLSHLSFLKGKDQATTDPNEVQSTPIFSESVRQFGKSLKKNPFAQYGLLGGDANKITENVYIESLMSTENDPRLYYNIMAPSSVFICGSQGSGKSHTLNCLLENCLIPSDVNVLPRPLTGLVFHYDTFASDAAGSPCEAAYLSSHSGIQVRVLCPPTNLLQIERIYKRLPSVLVEELRIDESDLNTKRMLDLMAVSSVQGNMPLYLHVVTRILRQLRMVQQANSSSFSYAEFKRAIDAEYLTPGQEVPLRQRLETLESFMVQEQVSAAATLKKGARSLPTRRGNDWTPKAGQLTIVDLSCPCVTAESACALFNICLSLFLEQKTVIGRVIALDEAHKYMTDSAESATLSEALLAAIRLQRHLAARVFISTQEPTISPKLLDLCTITIVHRFTSPDWLRSLRAHLAGASTLAVTDGGNDAPATDISAELFSKIVALRTGEGLLFAPSAILAVLERSDGGATSETGAEVPLSQIAARNGTKADSKPVFRFSGVSHVPARPAFVRLEHGVLSIRVRKRITEDGGRSIMAG